ncbi:hypothetical protein Nepgr_029343 [Nepenthes gracilis]|uniref:Adenylate isopentenyltransferase n=1 Tax=Nepenthes gracilis TaxID=150966 RepID=A0AAD3TCA7_NEPGR|nr:hypothetical protein Nepgr_029343 [Nepenthes gracilis]
MKSSLSIIYKNCGNKFDSLSLIKPAAFRKHRMEYAATAINRRHRRRDKIVVIMGATGSGKSRLSIDLASRFPAEIINSDKIQVYRGLDITTNKIRFHDRLGVPHHLLGEFDSSLGEFTPSQYRYHASSAIQQIAGRRKLPLVVGGSNSFIYALLADRFNPDVELFNGSDPVCTELRYRCCFLWVDVSLPVLNEYLIKRVDQMLDSGMLDELAQYYESEINESEINTGLRKAIGVPEFRRYFRMFPGRMKDTHGGVGEDDQVRRVVYEEAVRAIKDNTCQLANRQMEKILRLKGEGWDLQKLDASAAFSAALEGESADGWSGIWERQVVEPSVKIVERFLE